MKIFIILFVSFGISMAAMAQEAALKDTQDLDEVTVRGQKPIFQQRPDGVVVNVQGSVLAKGSSLMQVLERAPGVQIDQRNNSILLNGKSGVSVMIDGRPVRMPPEQVMAMLSNLSANNIASVELLTTPGARYDAEGNAGIINIITRKTRSTGTSGNLSATAGYGWGEKGVITAGVAHNHKKISVQGSYTFSNDHTYSDLDIFSTQTMPVFGGSLSTGYRDTSRRRQYNQELSGSFDFRADSSTTFGTSVLMNYSNANMNTNTIASYELSSDSLFFNGDIRRKNRWTGLMPSFYVQRKTKGNGRINTSIDYLHFNNNQPSEVFNNFRNKSGQSASENDTLFSPHQRGQSGTTINGGVFRSDYTRQLNNKVQLEAGVKANYTVAESGSSIESETNGTWVNREGTSTMIRMNEKIGAGYASFNIRPSTLLTILIGSRYEFSDMDISYPGSSLQSWKRKKGTFFPTFSLSKQVNDAEWQVSYSKRISRPSFNDLASYASYSDPTAVYTGNPLLLPAIGHTLKVAFIKNGYSISLLAARDLQNIARYQIKESESRELLYILPVNIPLQQSMQLQAIAPFNVKSWWKMNNTVSGGWRYFELNHTAAPQHKNYTFVMINTSQTFLLSRGYSFELSGWYNSGMYNGSVKMDGFGSVNVGGKKEFGNGSMQLSVADILRSVTINNYYGTVAREAFDVKNHVIYNGETTRFPVIRLTYSKTFGRNGGSSAKRAGEPGEESQRIRKD